jgi:spermidine synthase
VVEVGRTYFDMNEPNLNVIIQDGRWGLEHSPKKYQIISIDAYRPPYIPWQLTTREFFQIVFDHLTPDGAMAINVGRAPNDRRLIEALASTIGAVFPSVYVVDIPQTFNSILYATVQRTDFANFSANRTAIQARQDVHPLLKEVMTTVVNNIQPAPKAGQVFTDDIAPIEWITNAMVVNYILSGNTENLK